MTAHNCCRIFYRINHINRCCVRYCGFSTDRRIRCYICRWCFQETKFTINLSHFFNARYCWCWRFHGCFYFCPACWIVITGQCMGSIQCILLRRRLTCLIHLTFVAMIIGHVMSIISIIISVVIIIIIIDYHVTSHGTTEKSR